MWIERFPFPVLRLLELLDLWLRALREDVFLHESRDAILRQALRGLWALRCLRRVEIDFAVLPLREKLLQGDLIVLYELPEHRQFLFRRAKGKDAMRVPQVGNERFGRDAMSLQVLHERRDGVDQGLCAVPLVFVGGYALRVLAFALHEVFGEFRV